MRKVSWTVLGIAGASLLLCGSGELLAQVDTATQAPGTTGGVGARTATGTGGTAGETDASSLELRRTVLQLQADLGRMSQELAQVRAELANLSASMGVGGSGQAGTQAGAQDTATGGSGSQGTAANRGTAARGDPGEAVVNAIYTGTVRSVSASQLVLLDEEGQPFTVELGERTRVLRDGERITARQLKKGTRVRATVDLLAGHNKAMEIVTLPAAQ